MRKYIGNAVSVNDPNNVIQYIAYDLEKYTDGVHEAYIFKLNEDLVLEKTRLYEDLPESEEYTFMITECSDKSSIQAYIEGGKYRLIQTGNVFMLENIIDGTKMTLEIFPRENLRTYQYNNTGLNLISMKAGTLRDWSKEQETVISTYSKNFHETDPELLMELVKTMARDMNLEVSIKMADTTAKEWRRIYSVNKSSPDLAFNIITRNLMIAEIKLSLLDREIYSLFQEF